jgi:hypothetical protein
MEKGHVIRVTRGRFADIYYNYRHRIENSQKPCHIGLTPARIHAMSLRYMIKEFLREFHIVSRHFAGLPIYQPYEQAKLGYLHERNETLYAMYGIDSQKFLPTRGTPEAAIAEPEKVTFFPAHIQKYLDERNAGNPVKVPEMA